jgi:hypothetical protein
MLNREDGMAGEMRLHLEGVVGNVARQLLTVVVVARTKPCCVSREGRGLYDGAGEAQRGRWVVWLR